MADPLLCHVGDTLMMKIALVMIILGAFISGTVSAEVTDLKFDFMGGHAFGENPVLIKNTSGYDVFFGNTSSRGIVLPDDDYIIRVEPGGLIDSANSPDAALQGLMKTSERNPGGTFAICMVIGVICYRFRRK